MMIINIILHNGINCYFATGSLIQNKLLGSDQYKKAKYIGVYLHTPKEAPTNKIIEDILRPGI
jgi:5-formyltetrahydrofolate cyclo-ligase